MPRLLRSAHPTVAVEITESAISAVRGSRDGLTAWWTVPTPEGAVRSSSVQQNLIDREALGRHLKAVRERLAPGGAPVALVLPDIAVRLAVLAVDSIPRRREEVQDLVAWRLKKSLPYRVDEALLRWETFPGTVDGKRLLLAAAVRRRVLEEHESLLAEARLPVGSVTASTLTLAEAVPAPEDRDVLLLNVGRSWFSILVTRGREPLFFRSKPIPEGERAPGLREAFVAGELFPTLEYHRRRLGGRPLASLVLHAAGGDFDSFEKELRAAGRGDEDFFPARRVEASFLDELPRELKPRLSAVALLAQRGWRRDWEPASFAVGGAA